MIVKEEHASCPFIAFESHFSSYSESVERTAPGIYITPSRHQ